MKRMSEVDAVARATQKTYCAHIGNHAWCAMGENVYEAVKEVLRARQTENTVWLGDHDEFVNELLRNAPDSWDDDAAAEHIAVQYVRTLEKRVRTLGGTLERADE